jgi:hypothetical protein
MPLSDFWHRRPLSRTGFKSNISVRCHAPAALDNRQTALVAFGIKIVEHHDVEPLSLVIPFFIDPESRALLLRLTARTGMESSE